MDHEGLEPLPRPPAALTAPPQRAWPVSRDLLPERFEPRQISRNRMVVEIPTDDLCSQFRFPQSAGARASAVPVRSYGVWL
jgi:hypothetical protein